MEFINRYANETEDQYIKRVCDNKDALNISWTELGNNLNKVLGKDLNPDTYRRRYGIYRQFHVPSTNDSEQLEALKTEKEAIRKERIKLQTANLEKAKFDRSEARQELYYEYIGQYIKSYPLKIEQTPYTEDLQDDDMEYLLTFADIHYGAKFEDTYNSYSPEICQNRFDLLFERTVEFIKEHHLSKLNVLSLGDDIQGLIHLSDLKLNDTSMVKSIVEVSNLIANFLNRLSSYVEIKYYHVPTANHTQIRAFGSNKNSDISEDVEYIISHYISDLLKNNSRIEVNFQEGNAQYLVFQLNHYGIMAMHGHTLSKLDNAFEKAFNFTNGLVDVVITGHYHKLQSTVAGASFFADKELIVCPSIVGADPYSEKLMLASKASALILGFSKKYGHTETKKIILN